MYRLRSIHRDYFQHISSINGRKLLALVMRLAVNDMPSYIELCSLSTETHKTKCIGYSLGFKCTRTYFAHSCDLQKTARDHKSSGILKGAGSPLTFAFLLQLAFFGCSNLLPIYVVSNFILL